MHYTGMAAAVFTEEGNPQETIQSIDPRKLSFFVAATGTLIIGIALAASRFWLYVLWNKNLSLIKAEAALEQKTAEIQQANTSLQILAETSIAREEKITAILTAAADGIVVTDVGGIISICNKTACKIFGHGVDHILSTNIADYIGVNADDQFHPVDLKFLLASHSLREFLAVNASTKMIPIELNISKSNIGNKDLYIFILRDITERKVAQEQLNLLNQKLVTTARIAGMAEVAACVLHNVGNVLNSINISSQILIERNDPSRVMALKELSTFLNTNKNNIYDFLTKNPLGINLGDYLSQFAEYWVNEQDFIHKELLSLNSKIQHIKDIIIMQQMLSSKTNMIEKVQINILLDDALSINSEAINTYKINVHRNYSKIPLLELDKIKILQIFVNLIKNAIESLAESNQMEKIITLNTRIVEPDSVGIEILDNGIGISSENLNNMFSFGFTTKKKGHGFGLHSAALTMQEMGGSLNAFSQGLNQGAKFEMQLPLNKPENKLTNISG